MVGMAGYSKPKRSYKDFLSGAVEVTAENISKAVSWLSAAANKRLKRIEKKGWNYTQADAYGETGPDVIAGHRKFSAKGKTKEQLFSEFKRLKSFFESQTSSVSGVRKQAKEYNIEASKLRDYIQIRDESKKKLAESERSESSEWIEYEPPLNKKERKDFEQARKAEKTRAERTGDDSSEYDYTQSEREWYNEWIGGLNLYNRMIESGYYKPAQHDSDMMRNICSEVYALYHDIKSMDEMMDEALNRYNRWFNNKNSYWDDGASPSDFFTSNN